MVAELPDVGGRIWIVREHLWCDGKKYSPHYEFSVYEAEIIRQNQANEICARYTCEEGYTRLAYIRKSREPWYIWPRDAALEAQRRTEEYLLKWGWVWRQHPDMPPMRRTWERYLTEEATQ